MALFFGGHVLWPDGWAGRFDWISALIALGATVALFRYRQGVVMVIVACGLIGLAAALVR